MKSNTNFPDDWSHEEREVLLALAEQINEWKAAGQTIVFVTGVFDLFHEEHQNFLRAAKERGDRLMVGIESDARVRLLKGDDRPRQLQQTRLEQVLRFPSVDTAGILPESFSAPQHHRSLIAVIRPDILAVSSHSPHQDKKQAILAEFGGRLEVVYKHNPQVSTTQILRCQKAK